MRISDWSSDVCSSDLYEADKKPRLNTLGASMRPDITGQFIETNFPTNSLRLQFLVGSVIEQRRYLKRMRERYKQNGRASCRERGCQYVYISVVTVSINRMNIAYRTYTENQ